MLNQLKQKFLLLVVMGFIIAVDIACGDGDVSSKKGNEPQENSSLVGTIWKLDELSINKNYDYMNRKIVDYSGDSCIIKFLSENKLIVYNNKSTEFLVDFKEDGEYWYKYFEIDCYSDVEPIGHLIVSKEELTPVPESMTGLFHPLCLNDLEKFDTLYIGSNEITMDGDFIIWYKTFVRIRLKGEIK